MKLPLLLAALLFTVPAGAAELKLPTPVTETLPNGLEIAWFIDDKLPLIDLALLVKSGFRDDPSGKSGTAELLSTTLDRGAGGLSALELARTVDELGASRSLRADDEIFSAGMHGLASDAPVLLDLLAKLVLQPDFPVAEFQREHSKVLDRWTHIEDYGETLVDLAYRRQVDADSPYARGPFSSAAEFRKVTRRDVMEFHKTHFTPKNSLLLIVGRVDRPEFRKKIEALFGGWKGEAPRHAPTRYKDKRVPARPGQILIVDRPELNQAQVRIGFRAPPLRNPDRHALSLANALLGEYFNSRLNSLIRDKLGLTYSISSSFGYFREHGVFTVTSATRNDMAGKLIAETLKVLQELRDGPLGEEEVRTAKDYLIGGFPLGVATLGAVAARWAAGHVMDLEPDFLNQTLAKVRGLTREQVQSAIQRHFKLDEVFIAVAGDAKAIRKSLEKAKSRPVRVITVKDLF